MLEFACLLFPLIHFLTLPRNTKCRQRRIHIGLETTSVCDPKSLSRINKKLFFIFYKTVTFSKITGGNLQLYKGNTLPWAFFTFLNCTNGTKSRHISHNKAASLDH